MTTVIIEHKGEVIATGSFESETYAKWIRDGLKSNFILLDGRIILKNHEENEQEVELGEKQVANVFEKAQRAVCHVFEISKDKLMSRRRFRSSVDARKALIYILLMTFALDRKDVAILMDKERTTIYNQFQGAKGLIEYNQEFRNKLIEVQNLLKEREPITRA